MIVNGRDYETMYANTPEINSLASELMDVYHSKLLLEDGGTISSAQFNKVGAAIMIAYGNYLTAEFIIRNPKEDLTESELMRVIACRMANLQLTLEINGKAILEEYHAKN